MPTAKIAAHPFGIGAPPLASFHATLELLPRNHWGGLLDNPEMVAAFVMPADPSIDPLLARALELLRVPCPEFRSVGYDNSAEDV